MHAGTRLEVQPSKKREVEKLFARSLNIIDRIVLQLSCEDAQKGAHPLLKEHATWALYTLHQREMSPKI